MKDKNNKWIYIIFFSLPAIFILIKGFLDNDIWYILAEGRYIVNNGIYYKDVLSLHMGFDVVVQNWLSAVLFWLIYDFFGEFGLMFTVVACNFVICYLIFKICYLISDNNKWVSLIIMLVSDFTLSFSYLVTRPQIFSFIVLLLLIYVLELYVKKQNWKYLIWLPVLSLVEINMHASLWWMIFLFTIPYLIDGFKCEKLSLEGYKKMPLFMAFVIALVVGLINPYGVDAITFIFKSYGNKLMNTFIIELSTFNFSNFICKVMFAFILLLVVCLALFRNRKLKVRYLCLICGTMILGFMTVKAFSEFIIVYFIPYAYFFKDIFMKKSKKEHKVFKKIIKYVYISLSVVCIGGFIVVIALVNKSTNLANGLSKTLTVLQMANKVEDPKVYSSFNNGGTVEFYGYKPYIDPRAEVFLKKNNHKEDIFEENYKLNIGQIDVSKFFEKYDFDYVIADSTDFLYYNTPEDLYDIMFVDQEVNVKLYAKKGMFTNDELVYFLTLDNQMK